MYEIQYYDVGYILTPVVISMTRSTCDMNVSNYYVVTNVSLALHYLTLNQTLNAKTISIIEETIKIQEILHGIVLC